MKGAFCVLASVTVFAMMLVEPKSAGAQQGPVQAVCSASKLALVASEPAVAPSSNQFSDIPDMLVQVLATAPPGLGVRCLKVSFSAEVFRVGYWDGNRMVVRALLDGVQVGSPVNSSWGGITFYAGPTQWEPHTSTINFVFPNVAEGLHTITMQFRTANAFLLLVPPRMGARSLVVHYE
jgi:hypothetical protein